MLGVVVGRLSLVGYTSIKHASNLKLPNIKGGVLESKLMVDQSQLDEDAVSRLNLIYAKNYSLLMDLHNTGLFLGISLPSNIVNPK